MTQQPYSAYTVEQWQALEGKVFDGAGVALQTVRDYARANLLPPIGLLFATITRVLASVPAGTRLHTGVDPAAAPNVFLLLIGAPGAGKDRTLTAAGELVTVTIGDTTITPRELNPGSGEGIEAALAPSESNPTTPVLFRDSEGIGIAQKMGRQGSTLRANLLKVYSGNQLGTTNKNESIMVPAFSYTASVAVCMQWDTSHHLLGSESDGLEDRLLWVEVIDPLAVERVGIESVPSSLHIALPRDILDKGITYPDSVVKEVRGETLAALRGKSAINEAGRTISQGAGHATLTRLKLAAGLALLRSSTSVSIEDWTRAGVLLDFSQSVAQKARAHHDAKKQQEQLERARAYEENQENLVRQQLDKLQHKLYWNLLKYPKGAGWNSIYGSVQGKYRPLLKVVLEDFSEQNIAQVNVSNDRGLRLLVRGTSFTEQEARKRVEHYAKLYDLKPPPNSV